MEAIGDFSRATGLTQRALRLYDRLGLLQPTAVDPATGYRWYAPEQRRAAAAIAALRASGMPLRQIAAVLAATPAEAHQLVDRHWATVEARVAHARVAIASVHALIDEEDGPMTTTITGLREGLGRVLFAAGVDPDRPGLHSVLVRTGPDGVRLVATDAYRLVECTVTGEGPAGDVVLHRDALAELAAALDDAAEVTLRMVEGTAVVVSADEEHRLAAQTTPFPDYEKLMLPPGPHRAEVDRAELLASLDPLMDREAVAVRFAGDSVVVTSAADAGSAGDGIVVGMNPRYLADGVRALAGDRVVLECHDELKPAQVTAAGDARYTYLLMPVKLA